MTLMEDLWNYDEPMPAAWTALLETIESPTSSPQQRDAAAKRLDIALQSSQAQVSLYVEDETARRHRQTMKAHDEEMEAAKTQSESDQNVAKSLTFATWVLAIGTIVLVIVTVVGVVKGG